MARAIVDERKRELRARFKRVRRDLGEAARAEADALIDRYSLTAGECLFIDDTPRNVFGARRLGMRGWHFTEDVAALGSALLG